jgi:transcriptional regulator with XRE-family HTH domain
VGTIGDSLQRAQEAQFTRKPPVSTQKRAEFLLRQLGSTRAVAQTLGVSQRTVERYLQGTRKNPPRALSARIDTEVKQRWQPLVRQRAAKRAATTGGITVETRAQFGYAAAAGSTDDPRLRRITEHLPPAYAQRLFDAHQVGATEEQLAAVIAEGLQEMYFKVELNAIDYLDLDW